MTDDPKNLDETQAIEGEDFDDEELEDEDLEDEDLEEERHREAATKAAPAHKPQRLGRPAPTGMGGPRHGRATVPPTRSTKARAVVIDPSLRIRDRVSEAFVIGTLVVFGAILLNALAFGHGGAFTTLPTAAPSIVVTPAPSGSVAPSGSPNASPSSSPVASPTVSPT